ncbi:extracellular solute-binding protein family 1 [Pyrolobus fumarii 1A]|uniref:Extracellular solute-binding protein family 1 n=1 Tax=Pyrolobus fumarii (strain DSM 11204 / 1A) TaxID=694429 RepID=G0EE56_PYRF1|nr:extracellular solute-binding protein [Pyrolobus fumarii]AEM38750.1 extracellular solute-binding protein family 1 [Pyrolobus fumarii 1A]
MALRSSSKITAVIAVIIIIAAIAVGLLLMKPSAPEKTSSPAPASPTATESVAPAPSKPSITGNLEEDIVSIGKYLVAHGIHEVTFTAYGKGDPNSVIRAYGIVEAAYRLNKILEKHGIDLKIKVKPVFERGGSVKADEFLMAYQQGTNPDIVALSYIEVAPLADAGAILDITPWMQKYESVWNDFYAALRGAVTYKGRIWGLPQDTEARPLYWRIDVAECIKEKTGKDILADLYEKVREGKVTWHEVFEYAKLAKETGCAEWGLIHRKGSAHPDLIQFIYAYGGTLEEPGTGKLVLDVPAVYKWLYTEWKFAQEGLLPKDMMQWDWAKQIHPTVVDGKTLIFIGGTWHWTEWQTKPYHTDPKTGEKRPLTAEEVKKYFYYTLFPAGDHGGKPVTLSQPFVWVVAANAGHQNPKYEELKDVYHMLAFLLVLKASDPDINAIHSIISAHLPVRGEAEKLLRDEKWIEKLKNLELDLAPEVKEAIRDIVAKTVNPINIEFLAEASKMLAYTHLTPKHPLYGKLAQIFADAVDKVLRGELTPDKAIEYIKQKIQADPELAKSVVIRGEIPKDWQFP